MEFPELPCIFGGGTVGKLFANADPGGELLRGEDGLDGIGALRLAWFLAALGLLRGGLLALLLRCRLLALLATLATLIGLGGVVVLLGALAAGVLALLARGGLMLT